MLPGGTFDKTYNHIRGKLYFNQTHIPQMLERSRCTLALSITSLCLNDSLELTEDDLIAPEESCRNSASKQIVITHGTDTMVQTAKRLAQQQFDKTIVLTGAMIPYAFGSSSDGFFNLGCALAFAQSLTANVYIAMHGRYFLWNEAVKNREEGLFEKI